MKFDRLLWQCLMPGEYEFTEEGITVRLPPEAKETVLMFKTDSDAFRDWQKGVKVCDLLFFYRGPAVSKPVLLFVELKGSDYEAAELQLENAFRRVWTQLDQQCQGGEIRVCAVAVVGRSVLISRPIQAHPPESRATDYTPGFTPRPEPRWPAPT